MQTCYPSKLSYTKAAGSTVGNLNSVNVLDTQIISNNRLNFKGERALKNNKTGVN